MIQNLHIFPQTQRIHGGQTCIFRGWKTFSVRTCKGPVPPGLKDRRAHKKQPWKREFHTFFRVFAKSDSWNFHNLAYRLKYLVWYNDGIYNTIYTYSIYRFPRYHNDNLVRKQLNIVELLARTTNHVTYASLPCPNFSLQSLLKPVQGRRMNNHKCIHSSLAGDSRDGLTLCIFCCDVTLSPWQPPMVFPELGDWRNGDSTEVAN